MAFVIFLQNENVYTLLSDKSLQAPHPHLSLASPLLIHRPPSQLSCAVYVVSSLSDDFKKMVIV